MYKKKAQYKSINITLTRLKQSKRILNFSPQKCILFYFFLPFNRKANNFAKKLRKRVAESEASSDQPQQWGKMVRWGKVGRWDGPKSQGRWDVRSKMAVAGRDNVIKLRVGQEIWTKRNIIVWWGPRRGLVTVGDTQIRIQGEQPAREFARDSRDFSFYSS